MKLLDAKCRAALDTSLNLSVPWYLITSYLYYHRNESIISDPLFDEMCKRMLDNWSDIKHPHKRLIKKSDLEAGTGFALKERSYPNITKSAAIQLLQEAQS